MNAPVPSHQNKNQNLGYNENSSNAQNNASSILQNAKNTANNAQQSMQQNLGYAVNQAKQESADMVKRTLDNLKQNDDWSVRIRSESWFDAIVVRSC